MDEANNTVWKAGRETEDCGFCDVRGYRDAERSRWPKPALSKSKFAVGLTVLPNRSAGLSNVARLDEWVRSSVKFCIISWAML